MLMMAKNSKEYRRYVQLLVACDRQKCRIRYDTIEEFNMDSKATG